MQILSFTIPAGATAEIVNGNREAKSYTFDCGAFGTISFTVPPGGSFRFKPRTAMPGIAMGDVDPDIPDGDNVVRIENHR